MLHPAAVRFLILIFVKVSCNYFLLPFGRETGEFCRESTDSNYKIGILFRVLLCIKQGFSESHLGTYIFWYLFDSQIVITLEDAQGNRLDHFEVDAEWRIKKKNGRWVVYEIDETPYMR